MADKSAMPDRERTATGISEEAYVKRGETIGRLTEQEVELRAQIATLEAARDRLNVLEEMLRAKRLFTQGQRLIVWHEDSRGTVHESLREAADAELRRRDAR